MIGQHAIVVGGSIGGLLAAEVLCRRFERVTLVERDRLPQGAVPRKGVPQWLEAMGYERPREQRVEVGIRYMTRLFRRRPEDLPGVTAVIIPPTPHGKRGGVMLAQEGDRWTVTLVANFCEPAPSDVGGFVEHARRLPHPLIHQVIRHAEPLGEPEGYNFPSSNRRMYEELTRVPDGLIVIGDAICSFNPIYGQGMSVSALEALGLAAEIDNGLADLPRRFFKRAAAVVDVPWSIAVGNDLRIPETAGPRTAMVSCLNWYLAHLHRVAQSDSTLAHAFMRVTNLVAPPQSLFAPSLMLRVLRGTLKGPGARPGVPAVDALTLAEHPRVARPG